MRIHKFIRLPLFFRELMTVGCVIFLIYTSLTVQANDSDSGNPVNAIVLKALPESSSLINVVIDETARVLEAEGIGTLPENSQTAPEQTSANSSVELVITGLDEIVHSWSSNADTTNLLANLKPIVEVVRDHQAFLMLETGNRQQLRNVFAQARGRAGPMRIGGLSERGRRDHLVGMMLMDAAGQDPTEFPYQRYESLNDLAIGLLTEEVGVASIPVSQALQMPLDGGIRIVATSTRQRQDVLRNVPTLISARIDMTYTDYIGLYTSGSDVLVDGLLSDIGTLPDSTQWSDRMYELGLVDDYTNEGNFTVNVLRELGKLKRVYDLVQ